MNAAVPVVAPSYRSGKTLECLKLFLGYEPSLIEPKDVVHHQGKLSEVGRTSKMLIVGGQPVSNITKKHPLELKVATTCIRHTSRTLSILCFTPSAMKNLLRPWAPSTASSEVDKLITANECDAARIFAVSGAFDMPQDENNPVRKSGRLIGGSNNYLRSSIGGNPQLLCAETVLISRPCRFAQQTEIQEYPTMQRMIMSA